MLTCVTLYILLCYHVSPCVTLCHPVLLCVTHADSDSEPEDNVRLWEDGWKERYYRDKFGVPSDDDEFRKALTEQYTRGLCWVLGYYYQVRPHPLMSTPLIT